MAAVVSLPSGLLLVHQHGAFQALRATPRADSFETAVRLRPAAALEVPPALPLCAGACRCPAATDVVVFISADSDFPAVVVLHDLKLNVLYPVRCAGAAPVVGAGACMAHVGGDSVVLWGGGGYGASGVSTFGVLSLGSWDWRDVPSASAPPPRSYASLTSLENLQEGAVLFGGLNSDSTVSNRVDYITPRLEWELDIHVAGAPPPARSGHAACSLGDGGDGIIIHGGTGIDGLLLDDVFILHATGSTSEWRWSEASFQGVNMPRAGHVMAHLGTKGTKISIVLFGGRSQSDPCINSHIYNSDINFGSKTCIVVESTDHAAAVAATVHPPAIQRISC